ncbi:plasmid partitioning protein RepB [Bradyrhizobium sp. CCGUVB23]|uniref:plasmid partitioning protein RepB n=1 Tax=Bradyrhizobium sp. CCGUVB23 TaxID=2949630 RepID=UPI0020B33A69|nr:plasmid partitioning protein RepB [Bradyrhizobium sp. CCGUVB23]MCP3468478.1 plasmid partitioning protein RepB [Bradyrhizobium sp. CCGUVB23]
MRKNLLGTLSSADTAQRGPEIPAGAMPARADYAMRGASGAMRRSLDELAEASQRMMEGETIVSLDPALVDQSLVSDRIQTDDDEYRELRDAIKARGQHTPILVRPHPKSAGRYVVVFGRRRLKATLELGLQVKSVIKALDDTTAIVAQGQENAARSNLSFIEKSRFAKRLSDLGYGKDTIKDALAIDDTLLSRMLSVAELIPDTVLEAIGAAKGVGRDRWEELKKIVQTPVSAAKAVAFISSEKFAEAQSDDRFNTLLSHLQSQRKLRGGPKAATPTTWSPPDQSVKVTGRGGGKSYTLALSAKDGPQLGAWILNNLESIYHDFRQAKKTGD